MFANDKVSKGAQVGCWATCHGDARTMPGADDKKTKYTKDGAYELMQWKSAKGAKAVDGSVTDKRNMEGGTAGVKAEGSKSGDTYTVTFTRKLSARSGRRQGRTLRRRRPRRPCHRSFPSRVDGLHHGLRCRWRRQVRQAVSDPQRVRKAGLRPCFFFASRKPCGDAGARSEELIHQVIGTRTSQALEQALDRRRVAIDSVEGAVVSQSLCVRQDAREFRFVLLAQTVLRVVNQQPVLEVKAPRPRVDVAAREQRVIVIDQQTL
jgi:hypothetical protein